MAVLLNMQLYSVEYLGFTVMDKRFSRPMLPWIIAEIKRRGTSEKVVLGIQGGQVHVFSLGGMESGQQAPVILFHHSLQDIIRFSQTYNSDCTFMYLLRDSVEPLLYCYLYQASDPKDVVELFSAMRDQSKDGNNTAPHNGRSLSSAATLTSLCADISPSSSHFFEVLYIGKIKVSHKKVPDTFIDDALEQFRLHELGKGKSKTVKQGSSHNISAGGASSGSSQNVSAAGASSGSSQNVSAAAASTGSSQNVSAAGASSGSSQNISAAAASTSSSQNISAAAASSGSSQNISAAAASTDSSQNISAAGASSGSSQNVSPAGASTDSSQNISAAGASSGSSQNVSAAGASTGSSQNISAVGASSGSSQNISAAGASTGSSHNIRAASTSTDGSGHPNQAHVPASSVLIDLCQDEEHCHAGSQDSGCNGELVTADHLNAVSSTVLPPLVLAPSNGMKLGDSIEAVSVASEGEGHVLIHQHPQPSIPSEMLPLRANSTAGTESAWVKDQSVQLEPMRSRAASTGSAKELKKSETANHSDQNRTMLFQVGRTDLRLISPDRKQILMHKQLKDVASCIQGVNHADHFGFICRELNVECYMAFVFKCQSESVADDVVAAIRQAFFATTEAQRRERQTVLSCEHCPMVWYNKLCADVEGQKDKRIHITIFRRLELLPEEEQSVIVTKFKGVETSSLREQNEFLMMLLRAHCEGKQARHTHDTAENRSEFLNQYLGGSAIFMKAKRSLTSSFDQLLKRKGSRDDFEPIVKELSLPMNAALCKDLPSSSGHTSPTTRSSPAPTPEYWSNVPESNVMDNGTSSLRPRSSTVGTAEGEMMKHELEVKHPNGSLSASNSQQHLASVTPPNGQQRTSPMLDIFMKVGHTSKMSPTQELNQDVARQSGSWRQAIFNRVVTPNKNLSERGLGTVSPKQHPVKRSRDELRALWKKAINQQLLLIRMEKENARLRARQEEATVKRIKLEYDEIGSCVREVMEVWDLLVSKESRVSTPCDSKMLLQAIRQGVPRSKRGDVWYFLAEQYCLKVAPVDTSKFPNYHVPYDNLLRQLTSYQHAILIDLGRTFPNHTYFSSPLGPGQLALYNLLKAYSLLDPEVGYCQGLSFVAGVLLLHMSEESAFFLLRHLMFRRGLRRQYLPDMAALQVQLYQLSRLLLDQHPELYLHFDRHDVAPTLYAAPWILTLFASQFPLGFVTRVFDLLFLENTEVLSRVAIALLGQHKDGLLTCDSFEEIMDYLKNVVPAVDKKILDKVMKQVFTVDVSKQLHEYEVEYHVLQEEMSSPRSEEMEALRKAEATNRTLLQQNQALLEQLEIAKSNIHRSESSRARLESQVRSLEVTVATMGHFIASLAENNPSVEIPGEICRIVTQLSVVERRSSSAGQSLLKSSKQETLLQKAVPFKINEETSQCNIANIRTNSVGSEISTKIKGSEEKPREMPYPLKSALSSPNLTTKLSGMSSFFASTHNQIKKQKLNVANSLTKVTHNGNTSAGANNTKHIPLSDVASYEKSSSVPQAAPRAKLKSSQSSFELGSGSNKSKIIETSQCDSSESGSVTLTSPTEASQIHPLDTCSDVHFTYGGTTKLKTIRPLRAQLSRNSSVDSIQILKSVGPGGDVKVLAPEMIDNKETETSTVTSIGETKKNLITG